MEEKKHSFWSFVWVVTFLKWAAGIVEDQAGTASGKRIGFFFCLWQLSKVQPISGVFDWQAAIFWAGLAFALYGLSVPEWFSDLSKKKFT